MLVRHAALILSGTAWLVPPCPLAAEDWPPEPIPRPALVSAPEADEATEKTRSERPDIPVLEGRQNYKDLVRKEAEKKSLPPDIADAVAAIESGYDPSAIGEVGEVGLMQVRPETAAMLGFSGTPAELARPEVNIHYGVAYLSEAWRLANGDLCRALMKYRAGHGEEVMSALSANYCGRARAYLASLGSPFANGASVPFIYDFASPSARLPRRARRGPPIRTAATSAAFWAAHEARIRMINQRIEAKWKRMAAR